MVRGEGAAEFGFDNFRDCRGVEVIMCPVVGDIPGSVEDGTKGFGLETWIHWMLAEPHNPTSWLEDGFINNWFTGKRKFLRFI